MKTEEFAIPAISQFYCTIYNGEWILFHSMFTRHESCDSIFEHCIRDIEETLTTVLVPFFVEKLAQIKNWSFYAAANRDEILQNSKQNVIYTAVR